MGELEVVEILRQIWVQQYYIEEGCIRWRQGEELPPAGKQICSPHDIEMRYSHKRGEAWVGYKVHLTETCHDRRQPQLITDVVTTPATIQDISMTERIQTGLIEKGLKPEIHLVDQGYVDGGNLARSHENGIELVGRVSQDTSWQNQQAGAISLDQFTIDWEEQVATCPQGASSTVWSESHNRYGGKVIHVRFPNKICVECPQQVNCTRSTQRGRALQLRPQPEHQALRLARQRQKTEEFKVLYKVRSGVEGTISQAVHHHDARRSRYVGFTKTHLHNVLTAVAINFIRISRWLLGEPRARTRISPLDALVFS
jgi:transposase